MRDWQKIKDQSDKLANNGKQYDSKKSHLQQRDDGNRVIDLRE